jgi:hypothetical protein
LCCIKKYVSITEEGINYIHIWFDDENISFNAEFVWNNNNIVKYMSVSIPTADE